MDKIKLNVLGITYSQTQSSAYALILGEESGNRKLPIIIGAAEAQAIAIELEKMKPSRPLTHDLFKNFAQEFNINIYEVIINKFAEGVFYAKLLCESADKTIEIDSRTSDAVAIAIRFGCQIYTFENILSAAGLILGDDKTLEPIDKKNADVFLNETSDYITLAEDELDEALNSAIEEEDYEKASRIRDEIKRRQK